MSEAKTVGRYRLRRRLGVGGLAEVHLAQVEGAAGFQRDVAVKLLHPHLRQNRAILDLFLHEARITATLHHPNIAQVYALEEDGGQLYMVMEHVDGLDLRQILEGLSARGETLSSDLVLAIAIEVARALQYAHALLPARAERHPPVVHRDLSPGNVMVCRSGAVKLLDFGVAKALLGDDDADRIARGKWPYMSPEQVRGEPLDGRSDLFSLGAVLYELLTGKQAFGGRTVVDSMRRVERADVPPAPGVEPVVEAILNKLLAREREERFPDAGAALEAMSQVLVLRGQATGDRELAALLERLGPNAEAEDDPSDEEETGVQAAYGVGDLTGQLTIPSREPGGLRGALGTVRPSRAQEPTQTDPFGPDQVTLPPTRAETPRAVASLGQPKPAAVEDEDVEVTADHTTSVNGRRRSLGALASSHAELTPVAPMAPLAAEPPPMQPSEPRVFFEHFMPAELVAQDAPTRSAWTPRNLLVLGLALAAILIAGVAILIAVRQQMDRSGNPTAGGRETARALPAAGRDGGLRAPPPDATSPRPVQDAGARRPVARPADAGLPRPHAADAGLPAPRPQARPLPLPGGRPPKGAPRKGELDLITRPAGAQVVVDGKLRGRSPIRLDVPPGRKIHVMLSVPGRGLYKGPLWMPPRTGRRLVVLMPYLARPFSAAKPGRTAIRVRCDTAGLNRVYLDGLDTGFDCPTPPIAVLPTAHTVTLYVAGSQRLVWKQLRPRAGRVTEVHFPH